MRLLLSGVLSLLITLPVALLIHEHGHLLIGLAQRRKGSRIGLGDPRAKLWWQWRAPWVLYLLHPPMTWIANGYYGFEAASTPPTRSSRLLLAAAGPGANLLTAALVWPWTQRGLEALLMLDPAPVSSGLFPATLGVVSLWLGLYNLIPMNRPGGETDGHMIVRALKNNPPTGLR